jgi:hypothetical protein
MEMTPEKDLGLLARSKRSVKLAGGERRKCISAAPIIGNSLDAALDKTAFAVP